MTALNVTQAAMAAGVSPRTITRYLELGKLSASKTIRGHIRIDVSELIRVFGEIKPINKLEELSYVNRVDKSSHDLLDKFQIQMLKEQNKLLKEQLDAALIREEKILEHEKALLEIVVQRGRLLEHEKPPTN